MGAQGNFYRLMVHRLFEGKIPPETLRMLRHPLRAEQLKIRFGAGHEGDGGKGARGTAGIEKKIQSRQSRKRRTV